MRAWIIDAALYLVAAGLAAGVLLGAAYRSPLFAPCDQETEICSPDQTGH